MKTNDSVTGHDELNPEPTDLYMGLGSLAYALARIDGGIQLAEMQTIKEQVVSVPNGDVVLHALVIQENFGETVEKAYAFGMRRFANNRKRLTPVIKKKFVGLLLRIAESHNGISRKEQDFIDRFRRDLRCL